jgi:hypothetical protein
MGLRPGLYVLPFLGCTGGPVLINSSDSGDTGEAVDSADTQDSGTGSPGYGGCAQASDLDGAETLALEHKEWGEASEWLMDHDETSTERAVEAFDSTEDWENWLDERGLYNPLPDADLEANDLVLIHQMDGGCISAMWTFDEAYAHEGSRVIVGTYDRPPEDPDYTCDASWVDIHLLVVGENEAAVELCLDEAEYGGPRG